MNSDGERSKGPADSALVSRLHLIEDQPLDTRADAYTQVYEQLRDRLEGEDAPKRHG